MSRSKVRPLHGPFLCIMLDIKFIRENISLVKEAIANKGGSFDLDDFLSLDQKRRALTQEIESLRAEQNKINEQVSLLIKEKENPKEKITASKEISQKIAEIEDSFKNIKRDFQFQLLNIPNIPHNSVPPGGEKESKILKETGRLKKFKFKPKDHIQLAESLDIIDFKRATKITGSNFVLFKGAGAALERALINFMLDLHTQKHGYKEASAPFIASRASMTQTAQLPKLEADMYKIADEDYFLIPTAEVTLTNIHSNEILSESDLPIQYTSYSPCFRKEAGSYGQDTKGLMRVHQFDKVELVKFVKPDNSYAELEKLLANACRVIELLDIPYRILLLASGEMSFASAKSYDIEIYAPGIDKWLEVSSCSNFEDFQARRANIRYKDKQTGKNKYLHTLNGSGVALARLVVSILENYQEEGGSVVIPKALRRYMGGQKKISHKP